MKDIKFDFNDILIVPSEITSITTRTEVNPFDSNGFLPLITAPMDTVVDRTNCDLFYDNKVNVCLPRFEERTKGDMFESYSLSQFEEKYLNSVLDGKHCVLIDTANGHIQTVIDATKKAKDMYGDNMVLMVGNVANPVTYRILSNAGADLIRCGIGNGNACWVGDTLITTNKGLKKIKDVEINDLVLTHTGNYEPVTNTISYNNDKELYDINGEVCTKNHEIYVTLKENVDLITESNYKDFCFFIAAELLDINKHLIVSWDEDIID